MKTLPFFDEINVNRKTLYLLIIVHHKSTPRHIIISDQCRPQYTVSWSILYGLRALLSHRFTLWPLCHMTYQVRSRASTDEWVRCVTKKCILNRYITIRSLGLKVSRGIDLVWLMLTRYSIRRSIDHDLLSYEGGIYDPRWCDHLTNFAVARSSFSFKLRLSI